jgi:hypothetical protein
MEQINDRKIVDLFLQFFDSGVVRESCRCRYLATIQQV